ncbi:hypothetical protein TBLA_0J00440 [Henningerozyma blattae CBS 6284]|uniref:Altered inheritance of mitochondria protein 41 n=1 Tax=Henningerozyma blattae (strain ATCC 34711 / CBS 6284 / DSM 70876 / NBRC 10599 / NRRL Y-10934 / UCD 77-7) TaxID=1071380 RepID=I2H9J2_HENB6|nr:hypothetical protein TBLA_0J00440 [Tetrapisispora blattae CBS 6284]CCH63044.1 hypothetical protein TBLA_0J00440 [Tetrapisispora blattae CBS 6284]
MYNSVLKYSLKTQLRTLQRPMWRYQSSVAYINAMKSLKLGLKKAMIAKDEARKTTIRSILSAVKNEEIDKNEKSDMDEYALFEVYEKLIKQRKVSIEDYKKNKRDDLVEKEATEMSIIEQYLKELPVATEEEIALNAEKLLQGTYKENPKQSLKDIIKTSNIKEISQAWNCSEKAVRAALAKHYKKVFSE